VGHGVVLVTPQASHTVPPGARRAVGGRGWAHHGQLFGGAAAISPGAPWTSAASTR
jgi:hypothetical protein